MEVSDITQQRKFLEGLAMKWEFRNWQDWYKTTREVLAFIVSKEKKITDEGGYKLFQYYESLPEVITTVFPGLHWI